LPGTPPRNPRQNRLAIGDSEPETRFMTVASLTDFDLSTLVDRKIRLTYDSADGPFTTLIKVEALSRVDGKLVFE